MRKLSKTKIFLLTFVLILGLVFFNIPKTASKTRNFFYSIASPIQGIVNQGIKQVKASWQFLNSLKDISKENSFLKEKNEELLAQNVRLKEFEKENELLYSYLALPPRQRFQIDLANVVGRDFQGLAKYILINKGSSTGIKKNMSVIAFENILIGRIIEVFSGFSKVLLITSSDSKIPALIQESRAEGIIEGIKENVLSLNLIPRDVKIEKNQTIVTSGLGAVFPKGLLIGRVLEVELLENEMFQKVLIEPAIDLKRLEQVFIIKK